MNTGGVKYLGNNCGPKDLPPEGQLTWGTTSGKPAETPLSGGPVAESNTKVVRLYHNNRPIRGVKMNKTFHVNTRFENGGFDAEPWFVAVTQPADTGITVTVQHRSEIEKNEYVPEHCDWLIQLDTDHSVVETMKFWVTDTAFRKITDAAVTELWERPVPIAAAGDSFYETFDE